VLGIKAKEKSNHKKEKHCEKRHAPKYFQRHTEGRKKSQRELIAHMKEHSPTRRRRSRGRPAPRRGKGRGDQGQGKKAMGGNEKTQPGEGGKKNRVLTMCGEVTGRD